MKTVYCIAIICAAILIGYWINCQHTQTMYEAFNKEYLAAQVLEQRLRHDLNDTNITISVYQPPTVVIPL